MAISPLNNTAMNSLNNIDKQNKDTLSAKQREEGFSNDNFIHTSDKKKSEQAKKNAKDADGLNPNSKISQEAFMRLLLEELRHQDPTSPMDSDKMLTQTSQLAALETQEKTNKTMDMLADKMQILGNSLSIGMLGAVGKMATTNKEGFMHDGKSVDLGFNLYFNDLPDNDVKISVYDKNYEKVDSFSINKDKIRLGNNNFLWDTRLEDGTIRPSGEYKFLAEFKDKNDNEVKIPSGYFKIDGVKFFDGKAYFMAGDKVKIKFEDIKEIKDRL